MRPIPLQGEPTAIEGSFELLCVGAQAIQSATPTARAAGAIARARREWLGLAPDLTEAPETKREAWRRGCFHLAGGASPVNQDDRAIYRAISTFGNAGQVDRMTQAITASKPRITKDDE